MKKTVIETAALEEKLGHHFKDTRLLHDALTLASNRHRARYERLEFLGDRVLGLVIAEMLYRDYPTEDEGLLARRHTALVRAETAAEVARMLEVDKCLAVPASEKNNMETHPNSFLCDILEALLGALYLDGGFAAARNFIIKEFTPLMQNMKEAPLDAKTHLQEWAQGRGLPLPVYLTLKEEGSAHEPLFTVAVHIEGYRDIEGQGGSKRLAQTMAAENFLEKVGELPAGEANNA